MGWKSEFFLLSLVVLCYALGLCFYAKGFLLQRHMLLLNSSCTDVQYPQKSDDNRLLSSSAPVEGCWLRPRFTKVVFMVIDALRYDFIRWQDEPSTRNKYHHNQLTHVRDLLEGTKGNSLLYQFMADPPTTTLQRLKVRSNNIKCSDCLDLKILRVSLLAVCRLLLMPARTLLARLSLKTTLSISW